MNPFLNGHPSGPATFVVALFGLLLSTIVLIAQATPAAAKEPRVDPFWGLCVMDKQCASHSGHATCAQLHCKAQEAGCEGNYSSGDCKDIKELHEAAICEAAPEDCGQSLPSRFGLGDIWPDVNSGDAVVRADPETGPLDRLRDQIAGQQDAVLEGMVAQSTEIEDRDALQETLGVTPERAARIIIGQGSQGRFPVVGGGMRTQFTCNGAGCICAGDDDCNAMFRTVCADPAKAAVCLEAPSGGVVCACSF